MRDVRTHLPMTRASLVGLVALVVALGLGASAASAARTFDNPVRTQGGFDAVWTNFRGNPDGYPMPRTPTPSPADVERMDRQYQRAQKALKFGARLRALNTMAMTASVAWQTGWVIGRTIDTKWLHLSAPMPVTDPTWTVVTWVFGASTTPDGWGLMIGAPAQGYSQRIEVPWPDNSVKCEGAGSGNFTTENNCGSQWAMWREFQTKQEASLVDTTVAVLTDRVALGLPEAPCGAGSVGLCKWVFVPEEIMEDYVGANAHPVPYTGQTTPNGNRTTNITVPTDPPLITSPEAVEFFTIFDEDEPDARARAGTPTEKDNIAWGTGVTADPSWEGYPPVVFTMPDCLGLTAAACVAELDSAGHTGTRTTTELDRNGAVVTRPAGSIAITSPAPGVELGSGDPIELEQNPDVMPITLPAPLVGETYLGYITRLQALGWLGAIRITQLSDDTGHPALGPLAPVRIRIPTTPTTIPPIDPLPVPFPPPFWDVPAPGWPVLNPPTTVTVPRVFPDEPVEFFVNPPTFPPAPPSTGTPGLPIPPLDPTDGPESCPCPIPALDFSPLEIESACDAFPFGAFCWVADQVDLFGGGAVAPHVTFDPGALETDLYTVPASTFRFDLDLANTPPVILNWFPLIRNVLGFTVWFIGLWILGRRMLGVSAPEATGATDGTWDDSAGGRGGRYV